VRTLLCEVSPLAIYIYGRLSLGIPMFPKDSVDIGYGTELGVVVIDNCWLSLTTSMSFVSFGIYF